VAQGTAITASTAISPAAPAPTGTVQLILDGNLYGSPVVVAGAATSLPLLTNTLQTGAHVLRVFYSGDSNHQATTSAPATFTILDTVGAFTLSPATTSTAAAPGRTSNPVTLTASPTGGFHSTINFACTGGLPSGAVCLFTPSSVIPTGTAVTTILTISPAATALQATRLSIPATHGGATPGFGVPGVGVVLAGLLVFFLPRRSLSRSTWRWSILTLLLALSTLAGLSGCGSGGVDPNASGPGALSAGSYAVTVTATGGSAIQTATVNLTIQ
jgi:hypothetical protein